MVATTGGVGLGVATFASLAAAGVWVVVFLVTRYASVASMVSASTLPLFALLFGASWPVVAFTVGAAVGIVLLHRGNIARLFRGTENRFELRRGRAAQSA
jgi:glycerol-3-phosphate acyltransferase PlsY